MLSVYRPSSPCLSEETGAQREVTCPGHRDGEKDLGLFCPSAPPAGREGLGGTSVYTLAVRAHKEVVPEPWDLGSPRWRLATRAAGRTISLVSDNMKTTCDFPPSGAPTQLTRPRLLSEQSSPKFLPLTTGPSPWGDGGHRSHGESGRLAEGVGGWLPGP